MQQCGDVMSNSVSNQLPKPPAVGDRQLALSKRGALAGLEQLKEQLAQWGSPGASEVDGSAVVCGWPWGSILRQSSYIF